MGLRAERQVRRGGLIAVQRLAILLLPVQVQHVVQAAGRLVVAAVGDNAVLRRREGLLARLGQEAGDHVGQVGLGGHRLQCGLGGNGQRWRAGFAFGAGDVVAAKPPADSAATMRKAAQNETQSVEYRNCMTVLPRRGRVMKRPMAPRKHTSRATNRSSFPHRKNLYGDANLHHRNGTTHRLALLGICCFVGAYMP